MLLWVDLETTGLSPDEDRVLEVAAIATDDKLVEIGRFLAVTNEAAGLALGKLNPFVQAMHAKNGLWMESARSVTHDGPLPPEAERRGLTRAQYEAQLNAERAVTLIDLRLAQFIDDMMFPGVPEEQREILTDDQLAKLRPQLAGSTISFDRAFMRKHLPSAHAQLHYRNVDVSSFNEIAKRFWPEIYASRPGQKQEADKPHRAMDDIVESIAVMKHYLAFIGPVHHTTIVPGATRLGNIAESMEGT